MKNGQSKTRKKRTEAVTKPQTETAMPEELRQLYRSKRRTVAESSEIETAAQPTEPVSKE